MATAAAVTAKTPIITSPSTMPIRTAPITTPMAIAGPQLFSSVTSTASFRRCERIDTMEVGMMVASDVPTASFIATSLSTSSRSSRW